MTTSSDVALVLGPGGPVGTAWLLGLAAGLRRAGVDLARADLIVGTSAGAIAGAALATGRDLDELAEIPVRERIGDPAAMPRALQIMNTPGRDAAEALREVGALAREAAAMPAAEHAAAMEKTLGTRTWPDANLLITAVDVEAGRPVVWTRASGVPLHVAVAASSAAPGAVRPVGVDGRDHIDGAFGGGANVHLAAGAGTLILIEPLGAMMPGPDGGADLRVLPDPAALEAFGRDLGDRTRWSPVYREGLRQSADLVEPLADLLGRHATT
ncbi:patatin-like phospholipase family protein [Actinomadura logoneensis]|uniref:Patatin-like phospholipase family protein n=1 Tax=Actinomadura logoneensis TaxID=2293572 RepID=A0A372JBU0_9ACTN|nr:patatin-like phospholipase family protein [Actinomadura logoneensis]RFU37463.1 patatin-like phospholipase family protein [Actinomadura logoneensis]